MNPAKVELKMLVLREIGEDLTDQLNAAEQRMAGCQGGTQAFEQAVSKIRDLFAHIDQDLDEGKEEIDLEHVKYAKRYLERAIGVVDNLRTTAHVSSIQAEGAFNALDKAVKKTREKYNAQVTLLENFQAALESGELQFEDGELVHHGEGARPTGARPAPGIAAQRKTEEAVNGEEKSKKKPKPKPKKPAPKKGAKKRK